MWWSNLYQIRSYARSSLWVVPLVTMPFAFLTTRLLRWIDPGWDLLVLSPKGAEATLQLVERGNQREGDDQGLPDKPHELVAGILVERIVVVSDHVQYRAERFLEVAHTRPQRRYPARGRS